MEEFKNEHLKVNVSRKEGCLTSFEIYVGSQASKAAFQKALKQVNKEVSLPGFRKGKAPESLLMQNFKPTVEREWKDLLLETAFKEAMQLTGITPLRRDSVKRAQIESISLENDSKMVVDFEAEPSVPNIDPKEINIEKNEPKAVNQEEIDALIREIRLHHATWEEVKDRGVAEGDFVDLTIEAIDPAKGILADDTRFEVKEGTMGEWMRTLLLDKKTGEVAVGMSEEEKAHKHGDDCKECASGEHAPFQPTKCQITINRIFTAALPELDDELAKKAGVDNVDTLAVKVKEKLSKDAEEEAKTKMFQEIETHLLENYPFDLPSSLLEEEISYVKESLKEGSDEEKEEAAKKQSHRALSLFYLFRKIAKEHQISVSSDELLKEMMTLVYSGQKELLEHFNNEEVKNRIHSMILNKKIREFLLESATKVS